MAHNPPASQAHPSSTPQPPPAAPSARGGVPDDTAIRVNRCQRGNPVLKHIRNVKWEFADDLGADYQLGKLSCALFLSMQYHLLHPEYIDSRIKQVERHYTVRVMLCSVDVENSDEVLEGLMKLAYDNQFTLLLVWSAEEGGRYLETFKAYEHKPADSIKAKVDPSYFALLTDALTAIRSVNKTDVYTLASTFGSLQGILQCSKDELAVCPGLGDKKVSRIWEALHGKLS
eukprot:TRINITY_DN29333_c0_g1_i1.p1 TRINITY_DN29333_c0_g1~~TRINITY_DN29333_c0_g1_i1.p1  ORF type:complete len:230 (+),score=22.92 TRINITY_DN29333_c0_g1_i1:184-873(+)